MSVLVPLVCLMPFRSSGLLHGRQVLSHEDVSLSLLIGAGSFGRVYAGVCGLDACMAQLTRTAVTDMYACQDDWQGSISVG